MDELARLAGDTRKGRKRIALVIPTTRERCLREHLARLSTQTSDDFDVILVQNDDFGMPPLKGRGCAHLVSKEGIGCAGGSYAGELFALSEGYEKVILADDDCAPVSDDLVESLDSATESSDIALPRMVYGDDSLPAPGNLISHYGCVRSEALRKSGLSYVPLFFGGDDIEMMERLLSSGCSLSYVDSAASHPRIGSTFITAPQKVFYYIRGGIMSKYLNGFFLRAWGSNLFFLYAGIALAFIDRRRGRALFEAVSRGAAMEFFKRDIFPQEKAAESVAVPAGALRAKERIRWVPETRTDDLWYARLVAERASQFALSIPQGIRSFGADIVFSRNIGIGGIIALFCARRAYLESEGRTYLVSDNPFFWLSPLIFFIFAAALPLMLAGTFCLTVAGFAMKAWKGADNRRYGLRE